jgi:hypothetical protein
VKRKGRVARRGLKEAVEQTRESMDKNWTSIKGIGGKSGGSAWKATELTSGDLLHVTES